MSEYAPPGNRRIYLSSFHLKHYQTSSSQSFRRYPFTMFALGLVTGGRGELIINNQQYGCKAGDAFLLKPDMQVSGISDKESPIRYSLIFFSCTSLFKERGKWRVMNPSFSDEVRMSNEHLYGLFKETSLVKKKEALLLLLTKLVREEDDRTHLRWEIADAVEYVDQNYMDEVRISELAEKVNLSLNHFTRVFKEKTGLTPSDYLHRKRMIEAKTLLFTETKVKKIAHQVGYKDEHYFSRKFKYSEGVPPTVFVKQKANRFVSLYYGLGDHLQTLGMEPVAAFSSKSRLLSHPIYTQSTEVEIHSLYPNYEKLSQLKPDFILTSDRYKPDFRFDQIAPEVQIPHSNDYRSVISYLGNKLGREKEALHWIKQYQAVLSLKKQELKIAIGSSKVAFIRVMDHHYRLYGTSSHIGELFYKDLELSPPTIQPLDFSYRELDLDSIEPDSFHYVFLMADVTPLARERTTKLLNHDKWKSLDAVKRNNVFFAHDLFYSSFGPTGRVACVNFITNKLIQA